MKNNFLIIFVLIFLLSGCTVSKKIQRSLEMDADEQNYFTGIVVYDTETDKEIINVQGEKYFTPASNTKLFTFYAALKSFKDSVPSFEFCKVQDSLIIRGLGDPGFLNDSINNKSLKILKNNKLNVYLIDEKIDDTAYGMGWSWDDYANYYMPEKSLFPVYGNTVVIHKSSGSILVSPALFEDKVIVNHDFKQSRLVDQNIFYVNDAALSHHKEIPFRTSNQLVADLLGEELGAKVTLISNKKEYDFKPVNRTIYDTLYTKMMIDSDNFIAEQLMLQMAKKTTGVYNVAKGINFALENYLTDIPQQPRWVDGSGLSRYNLFTPESMVFILKKMYKEIEREKLFSYFPEGGKTGTLKRNYANQPYIRAKSGTLSNNYCLSGYLITKKGTTLIFSFMNNHFKGSPKERKMEMEHFFTVLYEAF